jgi:putative ABC transport system ATP-binding protein
MTLPLFKIRKLKHSFSKFNDNKTDLVLNIEHLDIPRGKLVVLLGNSGSGKTTLLEMLGLMNHPPEHGKIQFFPDINSGSIYYDYNELWESYNSKEISKVRREHFSFIFQHPDMLPQFYVDQNICLTQMIQDRITESQSANQIVENMKTVGISGKIGKIYPFQLSGGEQQRAAFLRAVIPKYTVLFGDEPTGNLGEEDAETIFTIIRDHIQFLR